eukprot:403348360
MCGSCVGWKRDECLSCKDSRMIFTYQEANQLIGECQCLEKQVFDQKLNLCADIDNESSRLTVNIEKDYSTHRQTLRNLATSTQTSPIVISGSSLTVTDTNFVLADGALSNSQYMVTVDEATYTSGLEVKFTNCTFNISGNFLQTNKKLKITFDNCVFNVAKTNTLINIDYSNSDQSGCSTQDLLGGLIFQNSVFQDGDYTTTSSGMKLMDVKSLYDISFINVTFKDMKYQHIAAFQDYSCGIALTSTQDILFQNSKFINTNMKQTFDYDYMNNSNNQLTFTLQNNLFSALSLNQEFMTFDQSVESPQTFSIQDNTFDSLTLSTNLFSFNLNKSSLLMTSNSITNSKMNNFAMINIPTNFQITTLLSLNNVTNNKGAVDLTSGFLTLKNVQNQAYITNLKVISSKFPESSVLFVDTVKDLKIDTANFTDITLLGSDLVIVKSPQKFLMTSTYIDKVVTSAQQTNSIFSISSLNIVQSYSTYTIQTTTMKNSQIKLFKIDGATRFSQSDSLEYNLNLNSCQFSGNTFTNYDLYSIMNVDTKVMDLINTNCLNAATLPTCSSSLYYDTVLMTCASCPTGCATCISENQCSTCLATSMTVSQISGLCECPSHFQCQTGAHLTNTSCNTCSDSNCKVCNQVGSSQHCAMCQNGYYLDIKTYTCVQSCPAMSKAISSAKVQGQTGNAIRYCRPFVNNTNYQYEYYVDPNSTSHIELGTFEYPFKNMDPPVKEIFNFMHERETYYTVYHKRGTSMKMYYGIMPLIILNIQMYKLTTYGNQSLAKPYVYITDHEYLWPDSSLVSIAETYYDFTTRVSRGDMDTSEATKFFLKFNVFRGSLYIQDIDFQSIMFGDAWSNPLIFSFDAINQTVVWENSYLDLDGALMECYFPISTRISNSHINLTNYEYGIWNDFRWDCYSQNAEYLKAYLILENNLFTDKHQQALYNFIFYASMDDFIMRNNTFDSCTYLDMETRPFLDIHPQSLCDPPHRTQKVFLDSNKFLNLYQSNLIFAVNYMNAFNGTKIFSYQNNEYINSYINTEFIAMQIQNPSQVTVANNYYKNVTVLKDQKVFFFFSSASNISISNETVINNTLDDLYTIGAANAIMVKDFKVRNNFNTGSITETSAILRISTANLMASIDNFQVQDSTFMYGKAIEIESAAYLDFKNAAQSNNKLYNQDFFVFNQINKALIQNLHFSNFMKQSDKSRFAISLPTLTLSQAAGSSHELKNITFSNSQSSFLSVSQVSVDSTQSNIYKFMINNCTLNNNTLSSKDSLIEFGEINYKQFDVSLDRVNILGNNLELGTIYSLKMNCQRMLINNSMIVYNSGQFASLEPASSDNTNPLNFYLNNTVFLNNFAKADALIQLTTNSKLFTTNSEFKENYSIGRGSIVFADYQRVSAYFKNCTIARNYAYQGGAFYIQYSSEVEVQNCTIVENFAVTGGVAYVNNDGRILINNHTKVYNNSALNTCFLFLINTQLESQIESIDITQNDQVNPIIDKNLFMSLNDTYKHIQKTFIDAMMLMEDKVLRTIQENADSSVYAIKAKINFTNTNIHNNDFFLSASTESTVSLTNTSISDLSATGKMIQAVSSQIELNNVTIKDVNHTKKTDVNFYKISIVNKSFLRATMCNFENIVGSLLYVSGSQLIIEKDTRVKNVKNDWRENSMIQVDTSDVLIQNTTFKQLSSSYFSPIINFQEDTLLAINTSYDGFDKTLFSLESGYNYNFTYIDVKNGKMTWLPDEREFMVNSIVFDANAVNLTLFNLNVTGIFTNFSSPVVYIENDPASADKAYLNINNSRFINNSATVQAGTIYAMNTDVFINASLFENNTALTGDAGALFVDCEDSVLTPCIYNISNTYFKNNSAMINGGAIKYTFYKPNTTNNVTFSNNHAQYGNDMGSYPVQMIIQSATSTASRRRLSMLNATATAALGVTDGIVFQIDTPLVSGSLMTSNISLIIQDENGRILNTDNTSVAVMSSVASDVQVMKSKSVKAVSGEFTFDDVIIIGPPGRDILLKITSDSIISDKITKAFPGFAQQKVYLKAFLRLCTRGEYQSSDNKCIICSDGFYTLAENQTQCSECPENAVCQEGFRIITDQGYWRKTVNSTEIFACYNPDACLSGYEVKCAKGYGGNLCQSCVKEEDNWYSREQANDCSECISYSQNSWRLTGVSILVAVYFFILIFINIRTAGKQKMTTVYMRILTNYFQILTLAQSYDLSWDDNLKKFLESISFIAKSSEIILSVDCFVRDNGISIHPVFIKMVIACIFPIIAISAALLFWLIWKLIRRNTKVVTNLITSIIIVIFISLPPITSITFAIFNCVEIFNDGDTFLALDMNIQCWQDQHSYYANSFGIPIIIIWVLGLPLIALVILILRRNQLNDTNNLQRYGFLYVGLNHNAFYWEILLHFRKVLLISINVFFTTFKPLYRALIGFMLMIIYIEFLQKVQPYATPEINDLEFKANIAAFATFYGGLFFISDELPFGVSVLLFVLILLINLLFWFSWIKLTFSNYYAKVQKYLSKYICFKKSKQGVKGEKDNNVQSDFQDINKIEGEDGNGPDQDQSPARLKLGQINEDEENPKQKKGQHSKKEQRKGGKYNEKDASKSKKSRKGKNLDDSQRYALANDDSSRQLDDSARHDQSHLFIGSTPISQYQTRKDPKVIDKKINKKKVSHEEEEMHVYSSDDGTKTQKKLGKEIKSKKKSKKSDSLHNISDSITESEADKNSQKKKKVLNKSAKASTSDVESSGQTKSHPRSQIDSKGTNHLQNQSSGTGSQGKNNAGDIIDRTSSNTSMDKPNQFKAVSALQNLKKQATKVQAAIAIAKINKTPKNIQNDDSMNMQLQGQDVSIVNDISVSEILEDDVHRAQIKDKRSRSPSPKQQPSQNQQQPLKSNQQNLGKTRNDKNQFEKTQEKHKTKSASKTRAQQIDSDENESDQQQQYQSRSKKQQQSSKSRKPKHTLQPQSDSESDNSNGPTGVRAFQSPRVDQNRPKTTQQNYKPAADYPMQNLEDSSDANNSVNAKVHSVKYKQTQKNSRNESRNAKQVAKTAKGQDKLFEQKRKIMQMSMMNQQDPAGKQNKRDLRNDNSDEEEEDSAPEYQKKVQVKNTRNQSNNRKRDQSKSKQQKKDIISEDELSSEAEEIQHRNKRNHQAKNQGRSTSKNNKQKGGKDILSHSSD